MHQLFPVRAEVDPMAVYGRLARDGDRPRVRLNMISSADGAVTVAGKSGGLGGPADHALFTTLRVLSDVILVGAATVRSEGYGPARLDNAARDQRREWGLPRTPPIAVVTRECRLDWTSAFFTKAEQRPIIITSSSAAASDRARAEEVADVILGPEGDVDLHAAVQALGARGHDNVLAEGGPGIAAQLAAAGLIDELCLTVAPLLVGGGAGRILHGDAIEPSTRLRLHHVLEDTGYLFLRYATS